MLSVAPQAEHGLQAACVVLLLILRTLQGHRVPHGNRGPRERVQADLCQAGALARHCLRSGGACPAHAGIALERLLEYTNAYQLLMLHPELHTCAWGDGRHRLTMLYGTQEVDTCSILQACGLMFPKADGATVLFDLSLYERELLLAPPDNTYPLAVRMETITAAGEAEGHTLQVRCLL